MRSFVTRTIGAVALALASAGALVPAKASDDAIADWLNQLDACIPKKPMSLAVVGFFQDEALVSIEQAKSVRLKVERKLTIAGRVRVETGADIADLIVAQEATQNATRGEVEEQIRKAYGADALVFFEGSSRPIATSITFHLVAILNSSQGECKKVQSDPIELPVSTQPTIKDIEKTMQNAVQQMAKNAKDAKYVLICRFTAAESGNSDCTNALDEKLRRVLDDYRNSLNTRLKEHDLDIREEPTGVCEEPTGVVTAKGSFRRDPDGRSWMSIEFRRDGHYLGGSGQTYISTTELSCNPSITQFFERVETDARSRVGDQLDVAVTKSLFKRTDNLDIRIETKQPLTLYCWVLDSDRTAQVFLPVRGREAESTLVPGEHHYPDSFDLRPVPLHEPRINLIDCFGLHGRLPSGLHDRWMAAAPSEENKYDPKPLFAPDVSDLLERIRAIPGLVEATTRLVVR
jgi:hypothetical protein